jgi:hypothetical protein
VSSSTGVANARPCELLTGLTRAPMVAVIPCSPAHGVLKPLDVVVSVDGHAVARDGAFLLAAAFIAAEIRAQGPFCFAAASASCSIS